MIHGRDDLYADPKSFRPERFLGADAPDTYTWIPFGGGTRRCLGASFAQVEMRIVLVAGAPALRATPRRS
jgi:cytochrome P450 family 135